MNIQRKAVLTICFILSTQAAAQTTEPQLAFVIEQQTAPLNSTDIETRRNAVQTLRLLENPLAARAAVNALEDAAEIVRAEACEAAAFLPEPEAAEALTPLLIKDKSEFVRREAAFALGSARSKTAVPALIQALQTDRKSSVRAAAAIALGKIGDSRAVVSLSATLLAPDTKKTRKTIDEFVRRSAARSLGEIKDKSAAPSLIQTLQNTKNPDDVRREAARALGVIADSSAVPVLQANLAAEDYLLAEIARAALKNIALNTDLQSSPTDQ